MLMRSRRIQWNGCRVHDAASGLWSGSSITGGLRRGAVVCYRKDKTLNDIEIVIINKNLNDRGYGG